MFQKVFPHGENKCFPESQPSFLAQKRGFSKKSVFSRGKMFLEETYNFIYIIWHLTYNEIASYLFNFEDNNYA